MLCRRLRWLWTTPLGCPVDPEVERMQAKESGARLRPRSSSERVSMDSTFKGSTAPASRRAAARLGVSVASSGACASLHTCSVLDGGCSGSKLTYIFPAFKTPRMVVTHNASSENKQATGCGPWPHRCRMARAIRLAAWFSSRYVSEHLLVFTARRSGNLRACSSKRLGRDCSIASSGKATRRGEGSASEPDPSACAPSVIYLFRYSLPFEPWDAAVVLPSCGRVSTNCRVAQNSFGSKASKSD